MSAREYDHHHQGGSIIVLRNDSYTTAVAEEALARLIK